MKAGVYRQRIMVNKQHSRVNRRVAWVRKFEIVVLKDVVSIFLIDLLRLFVRHKSNSIDYKMKRGRFTDIYLIKAKWINESTGSWLNFIYGWGLVIFSLRCVALWQDMPTVFFLLCSIIFGELFMLLLSILYFLNIAFHLYWGKENSSFTIFLPASCSISFIWCYILTVHMPGGYWEHSYIFILNWAHSLQWSSRSKIKWHIALDQFSFLELSGIYIIIQN